MRTRDRRPSHSVDRTPRADVTRVENGTQTAPVEATQKVAPVDEVGTTSAAATSRALGDVRNDAAFGAFGKAGARNATAGLGMFDAVKRHFKRGLVVALLGLSFTQGGLAHALEKNAATPLTDRNPQVSYATMIKSVSATLSVASAPPPPRPAMPAELVMTPARDTTVAQPQQGRDTPIPLKNTDGTPRDIRRPMTELPARLLERDTFVVQHGDDPGDYYCEHALFVQQMFAREVGIVKNAHGETLTGFLHVPDDALSSKPADEPVDLAQRYARHREVIGAAVFGYFHEAKKMTPDDVRILITGYGPFMGITNNPAGGFVAHRENIDAAVLFAFGDSLVNKEGELLPDRAGAQGDETMTLRYRIKDGDKERVLVIVGEQLDVADHELSQDDPGSLIGAMRAVRPHAMLSLGVHGGSSFKVEFHADDGGLAIDTTGTMRHDGSKSPTQGFIDNYALARAIWLRMQATSPTATPRV